MFGLKNYKFSYKIYKQYCEWYDIGSISNSCKCLINCVIYFLGWLNQYGI